MICLGAIINTFSIIFGGILGWLFGSLIKDRHQESLTIACGVSTLFIGISGAMKGMLSISDNSLTDSKTMLVVISLVLGTLVGEIINLEDGFEHFGEWLKIKSVLDLIIVMIMTCSLGKGAAFSCIPVLILEGTVTIFARFLEPLLTDTSMNYISLIGSILIFCVGLNLVFGKKVRVANMLPALIFAVIASYIPYFAN